ncbi:MAG: PA14 domain-containing protein, partial [Chloroflexota bacterium]|nr:PA14 domain-containing protein [Chloroflexota bacterium]
ELFGRAMGLVLAFLLAASSWAINVSRVGMYNVSTPLFALLAAGLLLRGLRRERYLDFALAGVSLGLGLCFYAAFQLFIGVIGLFLLTLLLFDWQRFRRIWPGLLFMVCLTLLVASPMLLFAYERPEIYFARTKETSLFSNKAPEARWPALMENVRKHALMFNYQGDPNGRHNLPGAPMLDAYTGALMVLGLGLSLWRGVFGTRRPQALLLPLWLGGMLLGGILSLDFEAPQSLRAIGTLPAAYLLAVVPLHELWQAWRGGGGRYYPNFVAGPLLLLLIGIGYSNFHTYFYRQAYDFATWNAFSAPETITANLLTGLDANTEAYVISYFQGHPTLHFLARGVQPYRKLETTDHLPMQWPVDKKIALLMNADSGALFLEARRYYPNATFEEIQPSFGGPTVVYFVLLTPEDVASVQGLAGKYYANPQWQGEPAILRQDAILSFDWKGDPPLPAPFSVEWEGVLNVATYGPHQFFLQTPGQAELYIGEEKILAGKGDLTNGLLLAQGNHALRVRTAGGAGPFSLAWRPPDREPELIPAAALYVPPVSSNGLLGAYYANDQWQAPPALARIDPQLNSYFHVTPLPRPYTVEWTGKIAIPQSGPYHFGLESIDESVVYIDNQEVTVGRLPNVYQEGAIDLTQGLHDIRIRFRDRTDHTHINFYWTPPGAGQQIVPAEVLFPPQANYERVQLPSLPMLVFNPVQPGAPTLVEAPLAGVTNLVQSGLNQPKGIAAGPDGRIYVADTGNRRLLLLAPTGELLKTIEGGSEPFGEPFDVATDAAGQVYVLDAGLGQIMLFTADGEFLRTIPAEKSVVERARGLHVDAQARIWLANTPGERLVAVDNNGVQIMEIPVWPGAGAQPVDVTLNRDGIIFAADAGLHKLISYAPDGRRLLAWEIAVANTVDGSHLTTDADGFLYLSEPEQGVIVKLTGQGERIGVWRVAGTDGAPVKPVGLAVDPTGRIWFVDTLGGHVFVLEPAE